MTAAASTELVQTQGLKARVETHLDETIFTVERNDYRKLCESLRAVGFDFPRCLTGTDMGYGLRSSLHLQRMQDKRKAVVHTDAPYSDAHIATVSDIWGGVEWHERESYDLVGILYDHHPDQFEGHPRRLLLEDDWTIHPLQKRYDTRGYLMQDWQAKPWPSPAPHEEGFAMFPVAAAPAAHAKPAAAAPKAAAVAAPSAPVAASVTDATEAASPAATDADAAPKKVPKRFVPAGQVAPAASEAVKTETPVAPVQAEPVMPAQVEPVKAVETPAASEIAAPVVSTPVAKISSTKTEEVSAASEENPKIKRWQPKGAATPVAAGVIAAEVLASVPKPEATKIEAAAPVIEAPKVETPVPVVEKPVVVVENPAQVVDKVVEKTETPVLAVIPEPAEVVTIAAPPEVAVKIETPVPVAVEPEKVKAAVVPISELVKTEPAIAETVPVKTEAVIAEPETTQAAQKISGGRDDLEIIEGIGPRRAEVLVAAGIDTFAKLAKSNEQALRDIMEKASLSLEPGIGTWPIQADYLVRGDQAGFQAFTDALVGGKLKNKKKNKKEGA